MSSYEDRFASYVDVATRIAEFRERFPDGSLQPINPSKPYHIETIGDRQFVVYVAAAYRAPDDQRPGIGVAWERFPGTTPYTRDSELMNAETSAQGRAIVAALAADTRRGIASREEVRNRQAEQAEAVVPAVPVDASYDDLLKRIESARFKGVLIALGRFAERGLADGRLMQAEFDQLASAARKKTEELDKPSD